MNIHTIVLFPKIQVDTAIAFYLLKQFGENQFPGLNDAKVVFWSDLPSGKNAFQLEEEGYVLVDMGGGRFDHHKYGQENLTVSSSLMVAQFLGLSDKLEFQKLLELSRRDDLEGKGTLSRDPIDRAFGISGLLMSLVKTYPNDPLLVLNLVVPLFHAHYMQEYRRYEELPNEYESALQNGKAKVFNAVQLGKKVKIVYIETDNSALPSYLRSKDVGAHLVVQKGSTGHVNIISKQQEKLELHIVAKNIKLLEAQKNNLVLTVDSLNELEQSGKTNGLPHWYYDTRANTLQNGGINFLGIPPTILTPDEIELAVKQGLNIERTQSKKNQERFQENGYGKSKGFANNKNTEKRFERKFQSYRESKHRYNLAPGERRVRGAIIID